jgi:hypothetical protein
MEGFQLAARFSLATNRLQYCGPSDAEPTLYRAIVEGSGREEAESALARFEALYPYLEAIAQRHGLRPFDREVVEAYWIGNSLLEGYGRAGFAPILRALQRRGLPEFVAREREASLPEDAIPHHLFHVAFVGAGAVTGHVETTLATIEACRPALAEVRSIGRDRLEVRRPTLRLRAGALSLGEAGAGSVSFDRKMFPSLEVGDQVAVHWGWAATRLDPGQARALERYTERSLAAANAAPPPSPLA